MKENTKKTLKHYWRASMRHKPSFFVVFFSMFVASVLDVIRPLYYKQFFDLLSSGQPKNELFGSLFSVLIIIAILQFSFWLLRRVNNFFANYFEAKIIAELNDMCFAALHRHSFNFFNNNFVGSLTKKVKWFVSSFEAITDRLIWNIMPLFVNIIFITIVLFRLNIWLGVAVFLWLIAFLVINWLFTKFKLKYDLERSEMETKSTAILADTITNNANVKLFNGYQREIKAYAAANEALRKIRRWTWDLGSIFDAVQGFLIIGLELGVMFYAVTLWRQDAFTLGSFVLVQSYLNRIMSSIWDFGGIIRKTYENLADAEEMTVVLATPPEIKDMARAKDLQVANGKIEFKNVDFGYLSGRKILNDFNLIIPKRQRLAVIGPSGGGKTTLLKLIFRMHNINGGKILIDGQDVAKVTQESLWQNVSLVPQEPMLFHRTLKDNIAYGRPEATEEEILAAAKAAHCHEFISGLEYGYETFVGERGIKLSGGERQRVAIARAILKDTPILVLDEATSSLDSESEALIQDALNNLMKEKTVIVVAHRLSTIRKMDRIIVIDKGQVVEDDDHDALAKNKEGIYARLWKMQAGGFIK